MLGNQQQEIKPCFYIKCQNAHLLLIGVNTCQGLKNVSETKVEPSTLLEKDESYLHHRSHGDNISEAFPLIREAFTGKYIHLDFSENLTLKPKYEIQDARFS